MFFHRRTQTHGRMTGVLTVLISFPRNMTNIVLIASPFHHFSSLPMKETWEKWGGISQGKYRDQLGSPWRKLLHFELSPPWHLYVLLLAYLLAFYLAYLLQYVLAYLLALYLAYLLAFYLTFYLAYLLAFYLAYLLAFYLAYLLAFYLANILALYLAYLLAFFLTFYLAFYLAYLLAFYLAVEVQRCSLSSEGPRLRSSGAHWARRVPGWGPAVLTELGRSQVEVQRCSLSSEGCRLRSSGAQCTQTLAVEVQQCPLRAEVGEELGEELARRKWTWEWMQRWWRRMRRRRRRRRRRTILIKSLTTLTWQVGKNSMPKVQCLASNEQANVTCQFYWHVRRHFYVFLFCCFLASASSSCSHTSRWYELLFFVLSADGVSVEDVKTKVRIDA